MAERSNLALFTVLVAIIGIITVVALPDQPEFGLTILFVAILFYAGTIVRNRLQRIGAEAFALGSIIVWTGFALFATPVLANAWELIDFQAQIILFILGIILIIVGYTTEYYDLNVQFLEFLRNTRKQLANAIQAVTSRLFRSVWTVLSLITIVWLVSSFFIPQVLNPIPDLGPEWYRQGILSLFLALFLIIEFREVVGLAISTVYRFSALFVTAIVTRLRHLPGMIRRLGAIIYERTSILLGYLVFDTYLLGFVLSIIFGFIAFFRDEDILLSLSIILLLATLTTLLSQRREQIASGIGRIQQAAYGQSFRFRNLVSGQASGTCPYCNSELQGGSMACNNCRNFLPLCIICRKAMLGGEEILTCSECEYSGHKEHLEKWISIRPTCPNCKTRWT